MTKRTQRRLAAIVSTDVVGYSRLMGADESGTLARMKAHRQDLWTPEIEKHGGRIVGAAGDSLLVEFASAVSAVECSLAVQQGMAEREAGQFEDTRMLLRIGINIGEVVADGDDIYGDGVNVAARLQALAPSGGICLSGKVHDEITGKVAATFEDAGTQAVKNIARPVQIWHWPPAGPNEAEVLAAGSGSALPLPDKPSVAVLPFDNMSGDPEQGYFADGMAEDIITALSRIGWLFVIGRNSSFAYKGKAVGLSQIGRELGVRYVLEGSVRKAGSRVRVTAQLIDTESGDHIWAEKYNGSLDDVFDLQDQITAAVVGAIEPRLRASELARSKRKRPDSLKAYDLLLRAMSRMAAVDIASYDEAESLLEKAIDLEPDYAHALGMAAWCSALRVFWGWSQSPADDLKKVMEFGRRALQEDASDPIVLRCVALGSILTKRDFQGSLDLANRSLEIDPNSAVGWGTRGWLNAWLGDSEAAIADFDQAMRLSPFDVWEAHFALGKSFSLSQLGHADDAVRVARRAMQLMPDAPPSLRVAIGALELAGKHEEAAVLASRHKQLEPGFSIEQWIENGPFRRTLGQQSFCDALHRAGLPA